MRHVISGVSFRFIRVYMFRYNVIRICGTFIAFASRRSRSPSRPARQSTFGCPHARSFVPGSLAPFYRNPHALLTAVENTRTSGPTKASSPRASLKTSTLCAHRVPRGKTIFVSVVQPSQCVPLILSVSSSAARTEHT